MNRLVFAVLLVLFGCDAAAPETDKTGGPISCELVDRSEAELVLKFSDPEIAAPGGTECVSLGGGVFDCKPNFCVVVAYAGNCPECPVSQ